MVADDPPPPHAGYKLARIAELELIEPVGLGHSVVVHEGDDVASRQGDADVARHGQIGLWAVRPPDVCGVAYEYCLGVVIRRAVDTMTSKAGCRK